MAIKHSGTCPFCKETITATISESNSVRRDKCICPSCKGTIYVCRSPGCDNYAKGGNIYDDELCPECTRSLTAHTGDIVKGVFVAVAAVAVAAATAAKEKEQKLAMGNSNSPLESLAAFAIVFVIGVLSTVGFGKYIEKVKRDAEKSI